MLYEKYIVESIHDWSDLECFMKEEEGKHIYKAAVGKGKEKSNMDYS